MGTELHRQQVNEFIDKLLQCQSSTVLKKSKHTDIVAYLKDGESAVLSVRPEYKAKFRWYIRSKRMQLKDFPSLNLNNILCVPGKTTFTVTQHQNENSASSSTIGNAWRRVVHHENIFDVLNKIHCQENGHLGYKRTLAQVGLMYSGVPRSVIQHYVRTCPICMVTPRKRKLSPDCSSYVEDQNGSASLEDHTTAAVKLQADMSTVYMDTLLLTSSQHKEHMQNFLQKLLQQAHNRLITEDKYNALLEFLKEPQKYKCTSKFRYWATKQTGFILKRETVDGLTVESIAVPVTIVDKDSKDMRRTEVIVIPTSALFDVTEDIHVNKLNHAGYKRVKHYAEEYYFGMNRNYIQEFCRTCPVCQGHQHIGLVKTEPELSNDDEDTLLEHTVRQLGVCPKPDDPLSQKYARRVIKHTSLVHPSVRGSILDGRLKQVLSSSSTKTISDAGSSSNVFEAPGTPTNTEFMGRVQVDLIDMTSSPDGEYNYICHVLDFFSQYHVLFPLMGTSSDEIAKGLRDKVFAYFGPAKKIYLGNGQQFLNSALPILVESWPNVTCIKGKASDAIPQEKIATTVKTQLAMMKKELHVEDSSSFPWANHLAKIMLNLNMKKPDPTLDSPFGVIFGRSPVASLPFPGLAGKVVEEEKLESLIQLLG